MTNSPQPAPRPPANYRVSVWLLLFAIAGYGGLVWRGWPQAQRDALVAGLQAHSSEHGAEALHPAPDLVQPSPDSAEPAPKKADNLSGLPPLALTLPFVALLACIACFPLIPATAHWWESNLHRFYVAGGLGLLVVLYFGLFHRAPLEGHFPAHYVSQPAPTGVSWGLVRALLENALLVEYIPFIVLLFSLYTICGGIRVEGNLQPTPTVNACLIGLGALLASLVGTTGAAMLAIRPLLETNARRLHVSHTMVFFIFAVCNCGGLLLPIGDPPLFLGYLNGVPFFWTLRLLQPWLLVNGLLLTVYWIWDSWAYYRWEADAVRQIERKEHDRIALLGLALNGPLLLGVILAVVLLDPSKTFPGTTWHPWVFLREAVQLGLVAVSLGLGSHLVRAANRFSFAAIVEVAALFVGIFITMQPALQLLNAYGPKLGVDSAREFFWACGSLSSVLDNAPTYLVFFETARSLHLEAGGTSTEPIVAGVPERFLLGISLGSVLMGAMTYIGNGPNFMVKAVAEGVGVKMPSFFGYVLYSACVLLPIFWLTQLLCLPAS